jgi:hypothetical protein
MPKGQSNSKPPLDLLNEAQFKVLLSDYNRFVGQEAENYRKFSSKAPLYNAFLPTFESLMMLHFGKGKNMQVPENVRMTFLKLMNDRSYLQTLTYSQLASLLQLNASPSLLKTSIKVINLYLTPLIGHNYFCAFIRRLHLKLPINGRHPASPSPIKIDRQRDSSDSVRFWPLAFGSSYRAST